MVYPRGRAQGRYEGMKSEGSAWAGSADTVQGGPTARGGRGGGRGAGGGGSRQCIELLLPCPIPPHNVNCLEPAAAQFDFVVTVNLFNIKMLLPHTLTLLLPLTNLKAWFIF